MKEVIFVILEGFADWEGAYIARLNIKPEILLT